MEVEAEIEEEGGREDEEDEGDEDKGGEEEGEEGGGEEDEDGVDWGFISEDAGDLDFENGGFGGLLVRVGLVEWKKRRHGTWYVIHNWVNLFLVIWNIFC